MKVHVLSQNTPGNESNHRNQSAVGFKYKLQMKRAIMNMHKLRHCVAMRIKLQ